MILITRIKAGKKKQLHYIYLHYHSRRADDITYRLFPENIFNTN